MYILIISHKYSHFYYFSRCCQRICYERHICLQRETSYSLADQNYSRQILWSLRPRTSFWSILCVLTISSLRQVRICRCFALRYRSRSVNLEDTMNILISRFWWWYGKYIYSYVSITVYSFQWHVMSLQL